MVNKEEFLKIMNGSVSEAMFVKLSGTSFFEAPASISYPGNHTADMVAARIIGI